MDFPLNFEQLKRVNNFWSVCILKKTPQVLLIQTLINGQSLVPGIMNRDFVFNLNAFSQNAQLIQIDGYTLCGNHQLRT